VRLFRSARSPRRDRPARLPAEARAALGLARGERVLAAACTTDGRWVAATATHLVGAGEPVPWSLVGHAQWVDDDDVLLIDPVAGAFPPLRLRLPVPGRLPETVHERVMASIVVTRRVQVTGGALRVVARRDEAGPLAFQVLPEDGTDFGDERVRAAGEDAVRRLRAELGE